MVAGMTGITGLGISKSNNLLYAGYAGTGLLSAVLTTNGGFSTFVTSVTGCTGNGNEVLDQWGSIWTASTGLPGVCVAYSGIKIVCVPPGPQFAVGRTSTCTVTPTDTLAAAMTLTIAKSGTGGATLSVATFTWSIGAAVPKTFVYTATAPAGAAALSFTHTLTSAFLTPAPRLFTTTTAAVGVVCSAVATAYWGQAVTCTVTPTAAPERGNLIFTPTLTGVGSLSVPSLAFTSTAAQIFIYNAPASSGGSASICRVPVDSSSSRPLPGRSCP